MAEEAGQKGGYQHRQSVAARASQQQRKTSARGAAMLHQNPYRPPAPKPVPAYNTIAASLGGTDCASPEMLFSPAPPAITEVLALYPLGRPFQPRAANFR